MQYDYKTWTGQGKKRMVNSIKAVLCFRDFYSYHHHYHHYYYDDSETAQRDGLKPPSPQIKITKIKNATEISLVRKGMKVTIPISKLDAHLTSAHAHKE